MKLLCVYLFFIHFFIFTLALSLSLYIYIYIYIYEVSVFWYVASRIYSIWLVAFLCHSIKLFLKRQIGVHVVHPYSRIVEYGHQPPSLKPSKRTRPYDYVFVIDFRIPAIFMIEKKMFKDIKMF